MCSLFSDFEPISSDQWKNKISQELKDRDFSEIVSTTDDDISIDPFYQQANISNLDVDLFCIKKDIFHTAKVWKSFVPVNKNTSLSQLRDLGQRYFELIFDDFQNNNGIHIEDTLDFLLELINLDECEINFIGGLQSISVLALIKKYSKKYDVQIRGSIDNDPIISLLQRNELPDNEDFIRCKNVVENTLSMPDFTGLTLQGNCFQELGASHAQELAYTMTVAIEYCDQLSELGLTHEKILQKMQFRFAVSGNYFLEIAKLRAAKLLWANVASQFDLQKPLPIRIQATTSMWNKFRKDRHTNIVRTTIEAMAAACGGSDAITIFPYDYPDCSSMGTRMAKNIHHLLQEEAFLHKCSNVASGSYYIEQLTHQLAQKSWELVQKIESQGGFLACVRNNYIGESIKQQKDKKERCFRQNSMVFVGVNKYQNDAFAENHLPLPVEEKLEQVIPSLNTMTEVEKAIDENSYEDVAKSLCHSRSEKSMKLTNFIPALLKNEQT